MANRGCLSQLQAGPACLSVPCSLHPSVFQTFVIGSLLKSTLCRGPYTPSRRFPKILIFTMYDWLWSFKFYSILFHFVRHETLNWFTDPEIGLNLWLEKHWFSCLDFASCANKLFLEINFRGSWTQRGKRTESWWRESVSFQLYFN